MVFLFKKLLLWLGIFIQSDIDGDYYKGISENVEKRLEEHNAGLSKFTSTKIPWKLVFVKSMIEKRSAIIEEKRIKKLNRKSLEKFIQNNIL